MSTAGAAVSSPIALVSAAVIAASVFGGSPNPAPSQLGDDNLVGSALPVSAKPKPDAIEATLGAHSFVPGSLAHIHVLTPARSYSLLVFRAGYGSDGPMQGRPITRPFVLRRRSGAVKILNWPSGLYYVQLTAAGGRHGYAPFVVRPRRLGEHSIAVVLPTNTWQAYNFFDGDGDGQPDSWYANPRSTTVALDRPFLDRGVPPHYTGYDRGFIGWLAKSGKSVDFLTDDDLERIGRGDALAHSYDLIVFSGHEEYVTTHEYDVVERYRDLGGNLMFLSANNFFYRLDRHGDSITRTARWRDVGRSEARLVGIQYVDWYQERYRNKPYTITGAGLVPWAFRGTGLHNGARFGVYGIEIDARTADSPRGIQVLARIPNIFGPSKSAEMTYYTTPRDAKVFAAGVINFGGTALWPEVSPLLDNLWKELSKP